MVTIIPGVYGFEWVGYQGHVIPIVVIACAILAFLEKRLTRCPRDVRPLCDPCCLPVFVTVLRDPRCRRPRLCLGRERRPRSDPGSCSPCPSASVPLSSACSMPPTVVTGIHQMYTAIDLGQLAQYGVTYWLPIASAANIAQGGAALAVAFKTRDAKIKGLALPFGSVRLHGHYRACHLRREPAFL